ncbi:hypothetical protein AVEN_132586-1 [Araneus ventricosus]|uniref:Uncharacterized protein n=1 Tax=Araneus ventricosus TaxID=182803 RepID=A0A4Y2W4T9_ARAVE|nr:hypothetical protein AVEN_132586-1 [Araneus ventricosus]
MAAVYPCDCNTSIKIKTATVYGKECRYLRDNDIQGFRHTLFKLPFHISGRTFGSTLVWRAAKRPFSGIRFRTWNLSVPRPHVAIRSPRSCGSELRYQRSD